MSAYSHTANCHCRECQDVAYDRVRESDRREWEGMSAEAQNEALSEYLLSQPGGWDKFERWRVDQGAQLIKRLAA